MRGGHRECLDVSLNQKKGECNCVAYDIMGCQMVTVLSRNASQQTF